MFTHSIKCIYHSRAQTSIPPRNRGNTFVRLPGRVMGQREGEGGLGGEWSFCFFPHPCSFSTGSTAARSGAIAQTDSDIVKLL